MREIKFRGIGYDGKWHYGYFAKIPSDGSLGAFIFENEEWFEVRGETVGQFTCVNDQVEHDIYVGDILEVDDSERIWGARAVVESHPLIPASIVARYLSPDEGCDYNFDYLHSTWKFKIIGNIYENPELEKGVGNG